MREISEHFGFSNPGAARCHLNALKKKGYIRDTGHVNRGKALVKERNPSRIRVPLLAVVPAGLPAESIPESDEYLEIGPTWFNDPQELFALWIQGDSMVNAGIQNGDRVIVRKAPHADSGQIVVARIEGEATIKRLLLENNRIILCPENENYSELIVRPDQEFAIEGIVVGLLRTENP